jgi:hypothetical protein
MDTATSAAALAAASCDTPDPGAGSITTIAEDRLEGAQAIGRFIDPTMTLRQIRRRLEAGVYPCWREGRIYVASKAALLAQWREKTAQFKPAQPQHTSTRRGYCPR